MERASNGQSIFCSFSNAAINSKESDQNGTLKVPFLVSGTEFCSTNIFETLRRKKIKFSWNRISFLHACKLIIRTKERTVVPIINKWSRIFKGTIFKTWPVQIGYPFVPTFEVSSVLLSIPVWFYKITFVLAFGQNNHAFGG